MSEMKRERRAVPLSDAEYSKTFATFIDRCTGYDTMINLTSKVIRQNKFDVNPIKMLSIGAGRGHFEVRLVQELNLKLDFIYAVEPTKAHVTALRTSLRGIGTKYHIDPSFFNEQFIVKSNKTKGETLFDFILMSHSLYGFKDPCSVVAHAASFLKPSGVMLLFNQSAGSVAADIYNYVVRRSNPELLGKTFQDNSLVPTDIVYGLRKTHPTLRLQIVEEIAHLEVDDFVRRVDNENRDDVVSFLLGTAYRDLSAEAQEYIHRKVAGSCDIIDGKYWMRHPEAAIQVYHNHSAKSHKFTSSSTMFETKSEKTAVPLSDAEYSKTFATFIDRCTGYDTMINLTSKVIQQNKFDVNPIKMLSIGAGRGHFEVRLVQELNLKLDFIYAVEPTKAHVAALHTSLRGIGTKYHIDPSFFNEQFIVKSNKMNGETLFDFILMSHSLYGFKDPCTVVAHAASYLKPSGVMLLFNQSAASVGPDIYDYVVQHSNLELLGKTFQDNSLVPTDIVYGLRKTHPELRLQIVEEMAHLEVDDFVRRVDNENRDDVVSFLLGTAYRDLSAEAQEHIYRKVAGSCDIIDGKYWMRHPEAAIQVYHNHSVKHHDTESAFDTTNDFASSYSTVWAWFKSHYESPTFIQRVGAITGMSVLDLACGPGYYARTLKRLGADIVVGVDVSESMLRQARAIEGKSNLGILYLQGDAADFKYQNSEQPYFDVVTAAYLFPYADSKRVLRSFCETVYSNLKPGGRFVTLSNGDFDEKNMNEDFVTPYGLELKIQDGCNGYAAGSTNNDGKRMKNTLYSPDRKTQCIFYDYVWSFQTIKKVMEEVGFEKIRKVNVAETMIFVLSATRR